MSTGPARPPPLLLIGSLPGESARADDAFFAPLQHLEAGDTNLYLGLVHGDSLEANLARVAAAKRHAGGFGVAAECGFGRAPPEKMPALIARHREVADALLAPLRR